MRAIVLAVTTILAVGVTAPAFAARAPTFARCLALSEQRGAGVESGRGNHRRFMTDCLGGKIPELAVANPNATHTARVQTYEKCADLSEQRGAGVESGRG